MNPRLVGGLVIYASMQCGCGPTSQPPAPPASELALEDSARALATELARGNPEALAARFDDTMKQAMPVAALVELWTSLEMQLGPFRRIEGTRRARAAGHEMVFVRLSFERAPIELKLVFDGEGRIAGLFVLPPAAEPNDAPPPYARLEAFEEREVVVGADPWKLPGTLALPEEGCPCPAVVLVHGSGPNDRDETVGANKPFRDIAFGLASRGIAVLRYDKRTKVHGAALQGALGDALTLEEETVDDVLEAVRLLRETDGIDQRRIFVLGHSAGGTAMPRIARRDPELAGFVIMAGSTQPLEDIVYRQLEYIATLDGSVSEREKPILAKLEAQVARVKSLTADSQVPPTELPLGIPVAYWLDLAAHPPAEEMARETRPVLVLHGDRDYQVTLADFEGWKRALSGSARASFKRYPKLNHLFVEGEGKSTPTEYQRPGHVAPYVIDDIADWIRR